MTADRPRIVDQEAHAERVALDAQIRALTDRLAAQARQGSNSGAKELLDLQRQRADAFRRETGWQANPGPPA